MKRPSSFGIRQSSNSPQVVAYYFPKLVDLHNYAPANAVGQKVYNWNTLNEKVGLANLLPTSVFSSVK